MYWIVQSDPNSVAALPHPIHLHVSLELILPLCNTRKVSNIQSQGHDFVVLGRSPDGIASAAVQYTFSESDVSSLNTRNPVRRDVTMLPPKGWVVIAYQTDNPGAWLM